MEVVVVLSMEGETVESAAPSQSILFVNRFVLTIGRIHSSYQIQPHGGRNGV